MKSPSAVQQYMAYINNIFIVIHPYYDYSIPHITDCTSRNSFLQSSSKQFRLDTGIPTNAPAIPASTPILYEI